MATKSNLRTSLAVAIKKIMEQEEDIKTLYAALQLIEDRPGKAWALANKALSTVANPFNKYRVPKNTDLVAVQEVAGDKIEEHPKSDKATGS